MKTTGELIHDVEIAAIDVNNHPVFGDKTIFAARLDAQKLARAAIAERLDRLAELEAEQDREGSRPFSVEEFAQMQANSAGIHAATLGAKSAAKFVHITEIATYSELPPELKAKFDQAAALEDAPLIIAMRDETIEYQSATIDQLRARVAELEVKLAEAEAEIGALNAELEANEPEHNPEAFKAAMADCAGVHDATRGRK